MQQHPTVENLILLHVFIAIIFNQTEIVCKIDYNPDLGTSSPKEIEKNKHSAHACGRYQPLSCVAVLFVFSLSQDCD